MVLETTIVCPATDCGTPMAQTHAADVPDETGQFALYECPTCHRKCALMFDADRQALSQHGQSWIENELREKGFIFPSDFTGSEGFRGGGGRNW